MFKLGARSAMARLNFRIGTKLAISVGVGVVLVAGMILNQQLGNSSVARQAERGRSDQAVATDLLHAGVALQRMQIGTREIRLAISEREADEALAAIAGRQEQRRRLSAGGATRSASMRKTARGCKRSSPCPTTTPPRPQK